MKDWEEGGGGKCQEGMDIVEKQFDNIPTTKLLLLIMLQKYELLGIIIPPASHCIV